MKTIKNIRHSLAAGLLVAIIISSMNANAYVSRSSARNFLNKTSYIIGEAYDMVYYYNYYTSGYLSKAYNHQEYAKYLFNRGMYRYAIYQSNLARRYALTIIYECDNYWDNYYRPYYYRSFSSFNNGRYYRNNSHYRPGYGRPGEYRPHNSNHGYNNGNHGYNNSNRGYNNGNYAHRDNVQGGINNNTGINATSRFAYSSNDGSLVNKDFDKWNESYYTTEETSLIADMPTEKELNTYFNENAVASMRTSSDKEVISKGISDFKNDISTYKSENTAEADKLAIKRPTELGTTASVTKTTTATNRSVPTSANPVSAAAKATATATSATSANRSVSTSTGAVTNRSTTGSNNSTSNVVRSSSGSTSGSAVRSSSSSSNTTANRNTSYNTSSGSSNRSTSSSSYNTVRSSSGSTSGSAVKSSSSSSTAKTSSYSTSGSSRSSVGSSSSSSSNRSTTSGTSGVSRSTSGTATKSAPSSGSSSATATSNRSVR